ncbi:Mediator of RNA polymerase II transcription subunit 30 [Heracleum sosnowskyi]|uniref:Mediator of RNA polymerase II transcription subunit 30 n=1 Tax=Heracleum sosnowskyi TaxID=360622 RepID=A0AAD8H4K3_9APIA|nr:Mediator of RNA polymerase II transcription subunit 30 [Heracleum sosnowskyi]
MAEREEETQQQKRSRQEIGMEGEKQLEQTIKSAIHMLSTLTNEFSNPTLWPTQPMKIKSSNTCDSTTDNGGNEYSYLFEMSGAAHYKSCFTSLLSLLASLPPAPKAKPHETSSTTNSSVSPMEEDDVEKLEERASTLRKELANKNKYLKVLMDQLRELTNDVSTWKSPCSI